MTLDNPIGIDFDLFLRRHGLICTVKDGPSGTPFGNQIIEYYGKILGVQMICDRGQWLVSIKDILGYPGVWFGVVFLKQMVAGGSKSSLSLEESQEFLKNNWEKILQLFSDANRDETYRRAQLLRMEYLNTITPVWPESALWLETRLREKGLKCEIRDSGDSAISFKCLQYGRQDIGVRFIQVNGWRIQIMDRRARPEHWYDIRLIRVLLEQGVEYKMPFAARFEFVDLNWETIVNLFSPRYAAESHGKLRVLEKQYELVPSISLPWPKCTEAVQP